MFILKAKQTTRIYGIYYRFLFNWSIVVCKGSSSMNHPQSSVCDLIILYYQIVLHWESLRKQKIPISIIMTTYYLDKSSKVRHSDGVWPVCLQTAQPIIKNGLSTTTSITPEEQNIPQRRLSKSHSKFLWLQLNSSMANLKKFKSWTM